MTQSKHTPGPWVVSVHAGDYYTYHTESGVITAYTRRLTPEAERAAEMEANARLIAAAPEMLEALQELEKRYSSLLSHFAATSTPRAWDLRRELYETAQNTAKQAIDKAEGRTNG